GDGNALRDGEGRVYGRIVEGPAAQGHVPDAEFLLDLVLGHPGQSAVSDTTQEVIALFAVQIGVGIAQGAVRGAYTLEAPARRVAVRHVGKLNRTHATRDGALAACCDPGGMFRF